MKKEPSGLVHVDGKSPNVTIQILAVRDNFELGCVDTFPHHVLNGNHGAVANGVDTLIQKYSTIRDTNFVLVGIETPATFCKSYALL